MRSSTRKRAVTLAEYLSTGVAESEPDWSQVAKDAAELAALARAEVEIREPAAPSPPPPPEPMRATSAQMLSVSQVADALGVSEYTVRRHVQRGALPASRLGGGPLRVRAEDLDAYVAAGQVEPTTDPQRETPEPRRRTPAGKRGSLEDLLRIEEEHKKRRRR